MEIIIKYAARQMPTRAEQDGRREKLQILFLSTAHNHRDPRYNSLVLRGSQGRMLDSHRRRYAKKTIKSPKIQKYKMPNKILN
jgi:hypothetical protein